MITEHQSHDERVIELREQLVYTRSKMLEYQEKYLIELELKTRLEEEKANRGLSSRSQHLISRSKSARCSELLGGKGSFNDVLYHSALMQELTNDLRNNGFLAATMYDSLERSVNPTLAFIRKWTPNDSIEDWIEEQKKKQSEYIKKNCVDDTPIFYAGVNYPENTD